MRTAFYIFKCGTNYIKISKSLKLSLTKDINKCAYWDSKKSSNTWKKAIEAKYPNVKLVECGISERIN